VILLKEIDVKDEKLNYDKFLAALKNELKDLQSYQSIVNKGRKINE